MTRAERLRYVASLAVLMQTSLRLLVKDAAPDAPIRGEFQVWAERLGVLAARCTMLADLVETLFNEGREGEESDL